MPNTLRDLLIAAKEEEKDPHLALLITDEEDFEEMDDADPPFRVAKFSPDLSVEEYSKEADDSPALPSTSTLTVGGGSEEAEEACSLSPTFIARDNLMEADNSHPLSPTLDVDLKEVENSDPSLALLISEGDGAKDAVGVSLSSALAGGEKLKEALDLPVPHPILAGGDDSKEAEDASLPPTGRIGDNSKEIRKARSSPPPINIVDNREEIENSYPLPPTLTVEDDLDEADGDCSLSLAASVVESLKEAEDSNPLSPLNVEDGLKEADNSDPSFDLSITEGDGAKNAVDASLPPALTVGEDSRKALDALVLHPMLIVVGDKLKEVEVALPLHPTWRFRDNLIKAGKTHLLPPSLGIRDYWEETENSSPLPPLTVEDSSDEEENTSFTAGDSTEKYAPLEKEAEPEEALLVKIFNGLREPDEKDSFLGEVSLAETGADDFESTETLVFLARSGTSEKFSELPEDGWREPQDYPVVQTSKSIIKFQDSENVDQGSKSAEELSLSPVTAESTGEVASSEKILDYELEGFQSQIHKENTSELEQKCEESNDIGDESKPEGEKESTESNTGGLQSEDGASLAMKTSLRPCPSVGVSLESLDLNSLSLAIRSSGGYTGADNGSMVEEAWDKLRKAYVYYKGKPVGTLAAMDPNAEDLNYNQVFVRDFVPSGLACLMQKNPEPEIVKNFLLKTLHLQGWEKRVDNFTLGEGVMPASFKVLHDSHRQKETLIADFGGSAIGRVAPVDSGFWWIILLRSYTKCTRDYTLAERPDVQRGMKLILNLCLSDGFDTFPTLLCADGCSMIDRRMGIYGYPIEIQALFYFALRCASQMLKPEKDGKELIERIEKRITALSYHIQTYFWLDFTQLNNVYRYKTEEYSHTAVNKFNVIPDSIPDWVFDFMPLRGGYFIGNVSPARMDFRWFLVGNCIAILSSLATPAQATSIMDLIEERWEDLIGEMPLKIAYPALEGHEWRTVTGFDPKNTRWSYHNGGSWPVLLWLLTAACIKTGRPQIAKRAIELIEQRLSKDGWPEYYDGKTGRYVGKQARKLQTWSISGYLVAKMMIENPCNLLLISLEEGKKTNKPRLTRSASY